MIDVLHRDFVEVAFVSLASFDRFRVLDEREIFTHSFVVRMKFSVLSRPPDVERAFLACKTKYENDSIRLEDTSDVPRTEGFKPVFS